MISNGTVYFAPSTFISFLLYFFQYSEKTPKHIRHIGCLLIELHVDDLLVLRITAVFQQPCFYNRCLAAVNLLFRVDAQFGLRQQRDRVGRIVENRAKQIPDENV